MENVILKGYKIGKVVDNKDPKHYQRVRVEIPGLTEGIPIKDLPFYPLLKNTPNNNNSKIPEINSYVVVAFLDDSIYNGIVIGNLPARPQQ